MARALKLNNYPDPRDEDNKDTAFDMAAQLRIIVRMPITGMQEKGISPDEMRKNIRLLDILDPEGDDAHIPESGDTVTIEDNDFNYLVEKVKAFKWPFTDRRIIRFIEDIDKAETVKTETKSKRGKVSA